MEHLHMLHIYMQSRTVQWMMKRAFLVYILLLAFSSATLSQTLKGKVVGITGNREEPLPGASVAWINTAAGTLTDSNGEFEILADNIADSRLVITFIGFRTDTVNAGNAAWLTVKLHAGKSSLEEVEITGRRATSFISSDPVKTEVITSAELTKSACCDLAGCFETQGTVQPTTTNIVTNSKELRILGLSGVYNQVLIDGMPLIQGLSYTYGISSIPGTLIGNIYVAKGANSVLQGFESISGQINVTLKEPDKTDKLLLNAYMNSFLEKQFNANYAYRRNKWSTLVAGHLVLPAQRIDRDGDTFLDLPLLTRYMLYSKWKYRDEDSIGLYSTFALRYTDEQRTGGQTGFSDIHKGSTTLYGQVVNISQPEFYTKTGFRFNENNALTLISSLLYQRQGSYYGTLKYDAEQLSAYFNVQYERKWLEHEFKTGVSYRNLTLREDIAFPGASLERTYAGQYTKQESVPGIFAENTFHWKEDKYVLITGLRLDRHNAFGFFLTPRTLLKYAATDKVTIRASAGTGFRTVNLFSENTNLLASSRNIIIAGDLQPERALNWGINLTKRIEAGNAEGSYGFDFYRTTFRNQIFPDYDTDPTKAVIADFTGTSASNGFQGETSVTLYERFDIRLSYTFLDVYRMVNGKKKELPFNSRHKVLSSLSYMPLSEKWRMDMNIHWYGKQKLPATDSSPHEFRYGSASRPYTLINAQFTKVIQKFEIYGGCENIFDFRQLKPIVSWQNPFGPYFDTSSVWGPTRGRELYIGFRYKTG
jgi:outer membrane receptor for ferrienterochelin and colicins